jgi:hypothetical protein
MISTFGFALGPFYQSILLASMFAAVAMLLLAAQPYKCPAACRVAVLSVCALFYSPSGADLHPPQKHQPAFSIWQHHGCRGCACKLDVLGGHNVETNVDGRLGYCERCREDAGMFQLLYCYDKVSVLV